jgi:hypothetical protein
MEAEKRVIIQGLFRRQMIYGDSAKIFKPVRNHQGLWMEEKLPIPALHSVVHQVIPNSPIILIWRAQKKVAM